MSLALIASVTLFSCSEQEPVADDLSVSDEVTAQIAALGFDVENFVPTQFENGYLVEGDIYLTDESIAEMGRGILSRLLSSTAQITLLMLAVAE